jgi:drug/metabolite transporter superfamily protein YnfA
MANHKGSSLTVIILIVTILIMIVGMITLTEASGSTLHVPGSYSTIQEAIKNSSPMDEIVIADGTYIGEGFTEISVSKPITLRSENGPSFCIIDCEGFGTAVHMSWDTSIVSGFTFKNAGDTAVKIDGGTLSNCIITDSKGSLGGGIYSYTGSPVIKNCVISNNTANAGGGLYGYVNTRYIISNCTITNNFANTGAGIYCYGNNVINSSIIANNLTGGNGGGFFYYEEGNEIINSFIYNNNSTNGVIYTGTLGFVTLIHCTVIDNVSANSPGVFYAKYGGVSAVVINSVFWNNSPNHADPENVIVSYSNMQGGGFEGEGNIDLDPLFGNNYHLTEGSPCINAGTAETETFIDLPSTDFNGQVRPIASTYDMGADESSLTPNDPIANAGHDQIVGETITLDGSSSSDPDGSITSYQWDIVHNLNPTLNRTMSSEVSYTILTELKKGFYNVTLTVTDNTGSTSSDDMFFSATGNPLKDYDVNGDFQIGLAEVIYYLQIVAAQEGK